ncbi:MAG TPA: ATP-binding cassette domain-containing protein [Syntrophaceticus sp.]|jgi:ABC-type dipeptide/oligopeptide/nickel transport system ATPase subunit|nr:ATP-binding cassette domain-containing protein [Syntrophaceticus schinkii]HHY29682.1 ATP-binding cassette domain-containing protein [Syntrophaceticus sp.]
MVLSIALGVFLIVTIGSLAESARVLRVNDMRQNTGVNHVFYTGLNNNQIDKIKAHDNVKAAANCFNYDLWKSENGLEVNVLAGEEKILSMLDTKIVEGKYPTEPNEIALEKWVLDRLNLPHQLNGNIKVSLYEHGEKEFKLVGIVENRLHSQSHDFRDAFVAFNDEYLAGKEDSVETSVGIDKEFIEELMRTLKIIDKKNALPNQLSGGQQQRIAIARALATRPSIVLADEPTGNLDSKTSLEVVNLLKQSVRIYHQTLVMITHDEKLAQMAGRIVRIEETERFLTRGENLVKIHENSVEIYQRVSKKVCCFSLNQIL